MRRRAGAPMTPLAPGCDQAWFAVSVCGRWWYERTGDPGTPWAVTFRPSGQVQWFTSLPGARRFTARPDAVARLRAAAQHVVDQGGRSGQVRFPLDDLGRPYRREVPEDPAECAARVAEHRRYIEAIDNYLKGVRHATQD